MTRQKKQIGKKEQINNITSFSLLQRRREFVWRDIKRKMIANGEIEKKVPAVWEWRLEEKSGSVTAHTKGEAKAQIKRILGLSKKKKLPREVAIQKVGF